jgi:hypothetical protein
MTLSLFSCKGEKIMEKEKVGKSKEAIYLTNLDDLQQIVTELRGQVSFMIENMRETQNKDYDEKRAGRLEVLEGDWYHILDIRRITRQLVTDINKQDPVLMVPVHSGQCCYIGKGCNHHVFQITSLLCEIIREKLNAFRLKQENYIFTKLGTLHQALTNQDNELCGIIKKEYSEENWKEKRHEIDGWVEIQGECDEVKRVVDNLFSETNKSDSVLLIKADSGESYYLGCGIELHVIHVSRCINKIIQDIVSENSTA